MAPDVTAPLSDVLHSGYVGQGQKVEEFEEGLRAFTGSDYCNTLNSGTSALHLALHLVKDSASPERDEILTTPITCTATTFAILANNLRPRWVDVDRTTCNIDPEDIRRKLGPRTLAIMIVHWGGNPCDLNEIRMVQEACRDEFGFYPPVIEDCAHALGAQYQNKRLGNHGNICAFSFQAIKHLTTGDGGLLVSPDDHMHRRAKLLRWYGLDRTSSVDMRCDQNVGEWGYKFHMNDINATIGLRNLRHMEQVVSTHQENGEFYNDALAGVGGVTCQQSRDDRRSAHWVYTLHVERRDDFVRYMTENGVQVSRVHDRNDKHDCVESFREALPNTERACASMICIPCGWWVTREDREYVGALIKKGW
jgi:dTDP-4-amino-4,6-dideoxygalactose transaminase